MLTPRTFLFWSSRDCIWTYFCITFAKQHSFRFQSVRACGHPLHVGQIMLDHHDIARLAWQQDYYRPALLLMLSCLLFLFKFSVLLHCSFPSNPLMFTQPVFLWEIPFFGSLDDFFQAVTSVNLVYLCNFSILSINAKPLLNLHIC